jgi:crotonobetainyl-CoA:carnitine CoA-transferase CaiB-like acyl-CoA transferase
MARIVELVDQSGAYAGRLLAELGHDVIRVETPEGDALRRLGPFLNGKHDLEHGAYHQFLNAGKRSLALDVASDSGKQALGKLLAAADGLLANAPLPMEESALPDRPVVVRLANDLPELCAYARSGLLALTGHPDNRPMLLGGHAAYAASGLFAAVAMTSGLLAQQLTGAGQTIDLSVVDCLEVLGEQGIIAEAVTHEKFERRGFRGAITAVSGAFRCADGYAMLSVPPQPENWAKFMEWVQDPVLADNASLSDEAERRANQKFVLDRLESWTKRFGKQELVLESQERHTPAAPVSTPIDLLNDPQLKARGFLNEVDHSELGRVVWPLGALGTAKAAKPLLAPRLGQHNAEILTELGTAG